MVVVTFSVDTVLYLSALFYKKYSLFFIFLQGIEMLSLGSFKTGAILLVRSKSYSNTFVEEYVSCNDLNARLCLLPFVCYQRTFLPILL